MNAATNINTEIVYSVEFLMCASPSAEFRVSDYGTARAAHAAAKEYVRSCAEDGDTVRIEAFRGKANAKTQQFFYDGFASGFIQKTIELTEEADTARLLALIFDEEEPAQAETVEVEEAAQVETKALAGHLHGFKHQWFGAGALRSVKSVVAEHLEPCAAG